MNRFFEAIINKSNAKFKKSVKTLMRVGLCSLILASTARSEEPVQVYIMAGQSNMEGKARVTLLEQQITAPRTKDRFAHFHNNGEWVERDDVFIKFLERKGKLTVGFGSPNCIGPELDFGFRVGDFHDQDVLVIKTAWGGKSLYQDFRPPSAGEPSGKIVDQQLENRQKRKPETTREDVLSSYGHFYRLMLEDIRATLDDVGSYVPGYDGQGYEIAGFVWFQGWNDMVNPEFTAAYAENMAHFIRDVRRDLKLPNLPFVIGVLGVDGIVEAKPNDKKKMFKQAQAAVGAMDEFKGNVAIVETDQYWDMTADAVFRKGWKENLEEWNQVGSDRPYHYLGSPACYSDMGRAFANALVGEEKPDKKNAR